jgi:hypothetical protein
MEYRTLKLVFPNKSSVKAFKARIPITKKEMTIYETIDYFYDNIFSKGKAGLKEEKIRKEIELRSLINLHNKSGMRSIIQIKSMLNSINSGEEVLHSNGMPNTRVVRTVKGEWVIFDGHHTTLAYMIAGRKWLHEIPHMIIGDEESGYVIDEEIHAFFGWHAPELKGKDWREYVINWQAPKKKQVQKRVIKNMGVLLDSIKKEADF